MGFPVILTPQSQEDLRDIVNYIAKDNPQKARDFGATPRLGDGSPRIRILLHVPCRSPPGDCFPGIAWHDAQRAGYGSAAQKCFQKRFEVQAAVASQLNVIRRFGFFEHI